MTSFRPSLDSALRLTSRDGMLSKLVATLIATALIASSCGGSGSYELSWTIGCETLERPACVVDSAEDCSRRGINAIEVVAIAEQGASARRSLFACFSVDEGSLARGPGLSAGVYRLEVFGLSPAGDRLTAAAPITLEIPGSGLATGEVNLPIPPACSDGVDNDTDGLTDGLDPQCDSPGDADEAR